MAMGGESHRFHHIPNFGAFLGDHGTDMFLVPGSDRVVVSEILRPTVTEYWSQNVPRSLLRIPRPPDGTLDGDCGRTGSFFVVSLVTDALGFWCCCCCCCCCCYLRFTCWVPVLWSQAFECLKS